jgi:hypothetical protein
VQNSDTSQAIRQHRVNDQKRLAGGGCSRRVNDDQQTDLRRKVIPVGLTATHHAQPP